jgi:hypothetical protein
MKSRHEIQLEEVKTDSLSRVGGWIKKTKAGLFIRVIVSVSLFLIVISRVDFHTVKDLFVRTEPLYFSLVLLMLLADRFLMAFKWNLLIRVKGIGLSIWQSFKIYLISNFFGIFLPTGIGGDIYRIYHTSKRQGQAEEIAASVLLERFIGTIASAMFAGFGFALMIGLYSQLLPEHNLLLIILGLFMFSLAAFWVSIQERTLTSSEYILGKLGNFWFLKKWLQCQRAYTSYRQYKRALIVFFFLSVIEQGFFAIANYWGAKAINLDIGVLYFIGIIPICQIIMRIPISVNAIGVQEGLYALFFSRLGFSVTEAFSLALLLRIGHWLVVLPGGILYLIHRSEQKNLLKYQAKQ